MKSMKYVAGAAVLALATSAFAGGPDVQPAPISQNGFYFGVLGGVSIISGTGSKTFDTGFNAGANLGYRYDHFRFEGAFTYINHGIAATSANIYMTTVMGNVLYELPFSFSDLVTPYIGAGLGWLHAGSNVAIGTANEFAYQGIAGLDFAVTDNVSFGINYRILGWTSSNGLFENLIDATLSYRFNG